MESSSEGLVELGDVRMQAAQATASANRFQFNFGMANEAGVLGHAYYYPRDYYNPYCNTQSSQQVQQAYTAEEQSSPRENYAYRVRIINPKNKRDFMDLTWHNMSEKFDSVNGLKLKLIDSFSEYIPSTPTFQIGYFEGRGSQKRWIVQLEDLKKMYQSVCEGDEIKLWCEAKSHARKSSEERLDEEPKSKRQKYDDIEADIRAQLEEKHSTKYTAPVYTLWAKFIRSGRHESYDTPPEIPLITGEQKGRKKKESLSEALTDAATAIVRAVKPPAAVSPKSSPHPSSLSKATLSPNNQANLRRRYLEDLRTLSQLLNDGVLTDSEFQEQKDTLLNGLRKLK